MSSNATSTTGPPATILHLNPGTGAGDNQHDAFATNNLNTLDNLTPSSSIIKHAYYKYYLAPSHDYSSTSSNIKHHADYISTTTPTEFLQPTLSDNGDDGDHSYWWRPTDYHGSSSSQNATVIAIATVVPIVVVAILVLGGLFFWRKRKQRKAAEEERRKEVEEYGFNPNADGPTAPDVSTVGGGAYEDASSGYRGWGSTTLAGSTGRKASTTMSGGAAPVAYSDGTAASPTQGNVSDARSAEPLMHGRDGAVSPEGEILGAMGPSTSGNRGGDMRRGPSNASSSYSAAARSDGSGEGIGMAYGGDARYYDGYGNGPYADAYGAVPPRGGENGGASSPVIKDNPARRNTRIENSGHYPQQAGISQNF
ncbi:hypothetical protein GGTG_06790 [Gaeumannomyces tritici R3-111a-1]|uniref:Uncharacterized protein n=1 Tax=Gaeumannomyces tritici (strain R3-111a-1) TaxID=644352 RepID=J3NZU3_GAET3|nr:hypothetical protein GGTG_06790 [Gaeumannomyces tritici R3-111a-1]EJT76876.1 hypothetical protein GGTG_06790 [Gaeumannomyces tritici R3-111a-1]